MKPDWTFTSGELIAILGAQYEGAPFECSRLSTDTRKLEEDDLFFALSGENYDGNDFAERAMTEGAVAAVTSRVVEGIPCLVVDDVLVALQTLATHHRNRYDIPVLAITGSCGKTSCKDMIAAVLGTKYKVVKTQGNFNNAIGCPLSLMQLDASTEFMVLEMGANHPGEIAELCEIALPTESVITLIAPAHLEGFGTIDDVAAAKGEIAKGIPEDGTFYVNTDDPRCVAIGEAFPGESVLYGSSGSVRLKSWKFAENGEMLLDIDPIGTLSLPLYAEAHAHNVLLAVAVGLRHGVTEFEASLRVACMAPSRFRVSELDGIEIIDDTYNANPESMRVAIEALATRPGNGQRIAVLGCMGELGAESEDLHYKTGTMLGKNGINTVFIRGNHAEAVVAGAQASGVITAEVIQTHEALAERVSGLVHPGDVVLFKGSRGMAMERVIALLAEQHNV
jgi:UDP-N-acetylmuramoyl-tripeptide--D-alanyl-D-alanine ligase